MVRGKRFQLMTDDMLIRPFLDFDDDVEIIWPGRFFLSDKNEWCVRTAIQRHSCSTVEPINLSIGYMPLLCLGRCFSKGQLTNMIQRGEPG